MLAQLENVQSTADVSANQASVQAAETDAIAAEAALNTSDADLHRAQADYARNKLDWDRAQNLFKDGLISKSDFDSRQNAWATADSGLVQAKARVAQAKAQKDSADRHVAQARANLTRVADVLQKTTYSAPYDGVITSLPVREGESVVIGIQNALGSILMTLADMSVITAEVKVDETDIVNVHLGQPAEVTIDAIPRSFPRHSLRNWRQCHRPLHRRGDLPANHCQRGSQRFQSGGYRDRSSAGSASRPLDHCQDHHGFPQQRACDPDSSTLGPHYGAVGAGEVNSRLRACRRTMPKETASRNSNGKDPLQDVQGVFVIRNKKAEFVPITTGITGTATSKC